ncbi:formate dehydrogenase major subunit [Enhydrobacter aerosaccus]|nr:formate dehydrogenase major subunit [Enhydrobacter aerosaccus]
MGITRRQFMRVSAAGLAASTVGALGFGDAGDALAAGVRPFKLERATETRNACPYCAVSCGVLIYSLGDRSKNARSEVIHVEGDPDHPVNRGTLCPRGAAVLDFVRSPNRLKYPMHRKAGSDKFERVSWDFAMDRIARLMKDDRDKNFVAKNRDGVTVNRWVSTGFFGTSSQSNEAGYLTYKLARATGILGLENQARI